MTSAHASRSAVLSSLVLAAMLAALTPDGSRADGPAVSQIEAQTYGANEHAAAPAAGAATTGSGGSMRIDVGEPEDGTLAENMWDFTKPDGIPGFASTPYPAKPQAAD